MKANRNPGIGRTTIALAILAAFGAAHAQEGNEVARLSQPESSVSVGAGGFVEGDRRDRAFFGQYSGMRKEDGFLLFDFDYSKRNETTGTWLMFQGRNLGLDNRELNFSVDQQGNWKIFGDYNEITRHDHRTIRTGLQGAGTTNPTVVVIPRGTGSELNLKTERKQLGLGVEKWLGPNLQFEAVFRNEDKDGARLYGTGFTCTSVTAPGCLGPTAARAAFGMLMLPEPINWNTKQFEAKLNYFNDRLVLSGGYYGSFFSNAHGTVTPVVPGSLYNVVGTLLPLSAGLQPILQNPIALPPDNQAHQLFVTGNYTFTPTTKANFKYAYTRFTQTDSFSGSGLSGAPGGRNDLDGRVDNQLIQVGLTSRPMRDLSLLANVRYEDRDDKTPIEFYNLEGVNRFTNGRLTNKKLNGKVEGTYQFQQVYRATLGVDYESIDRASFVSTNSVNGLSGLRRKTQETGYRAELRRTMSETVNGGISFGQSWRTGSAWERPNTLPVTGVTELAEAQIYTRTGIFPSHLTDRQRNKFKVFADWTPVEVLSLQFIAEGGVDRYDPPSEKGLRKSGFNLFSVDAGLTLSENWRVNAYWSHGQQAQRVDHSTGYMGRMRETNDTVGVGFTGKLSGRFELGGELSYSNDKSHFNIGLDPAASAANRAFLAQAGGLPDVNFNQFRLKLFGNYAVEKNSSIRVDLIHERTKYSDWLWEYNGTPFYYSDGTTVSVPRTQSVTFLGATYTYRWQ